MKIEAEKEYTCRDGQKAKIYELKGAHESWKILGAISTRLGWQMSSWCLGGNYLVYKQSNQDLICEWEEPKGTKKFYAYRFNMTGNIFVDESPNLKSADYTRIPKIE